MSFSRIKCDLSVVSDLNTARMPCSCMQRRRGSGTPFTWGKTAVDLNYVTDSLLGVGGGEFLGFVTFCTKEEGQPFETRTDDKCFFSSEMTDGFVIRRFARSYNA